MSGPVPPVLLGVDDAAAFLGIGVSTLKELRAEGVGPRFRMVGTRVLYHIDDLRVWATALPSFQSVSEARHRRAS